MYSLLEYPSYRLRCWKSIELVSVPPTGTGVTFGTVCDGYASKKPGKASRASQGSQIVVQPLAPKSIQPSSTLQMPRRNAFANDQEHRYFGLFCERTASGLSGYFRSSLWNRIVLQACEGMPPIRHAIIALGTLDKTLDTTERTTGLSPSSFRERGVEGSAHHRFALQQYGKTIMKMRNSLSAQNRTIEQP
jgi:hypothetical protein